MPWIWLRWAGPGGERPPGTGPTHLKKGRGIAMRRLLVLFGFVILTAMITGCAASRGEGITIGNGLVNTGASQAERDRIARERTEAEISKVEAETAMKEAKTQAGIEQNAKTGEIWRKVLFAVGIAAAVAAVAIGIGYASKQATPALETALEIRKVKRLEISLGIGPGGYNALLLAEGYEATEISDLVRQNPALDAPRVQELQNRVGDRGLRLLADRGEVEETLALLPDAEKGCCGG